MELGLIFLLAFLFFFFYKNSKKPENENYVNSANENYLNSQNKNQVNYVPQKVNHQSLVKIDLLEKPNYSMEREIVVDPSDDAFYRKHFTEFAENGFEDYGLNTKSEGIFAWDNTMDNFAKFDKNDKGYLGTNAQNVHSSLIQDTIKTKYNKQKQKVNSKGNSKDNIRDIEYEIINFTKYLRKDYNKVKNVIDQIKERNSFIQNLNETETNILNNSWVSANKNVKEQIINELLDLTDGKNFIVCPTGVASRIINSNIVDDPESTPLKESDLRQEMLSSASLIRNELEKLQTFQNLSDIEQTKVLKYKLIQKYNKDYDGIISPERIQKELESWIDSI